MKKTMLIALSFILTLTIGSTFSTPKASAADGGYAYSASAKQALDYINKIRQEAGLSRVELDPYLTKAAENHTKYVGLNGVSSYGHTEIKGNKGFTGANVLDRVVQVGGEDVFQYKMLAEGMSASGKTVEVALSRLVNAPYHREHIIDLGLENIGAAFDGTYFTVTYSIEIFDRDTSSSVYPYNGQKGVDTTFFGNERPDPLADTGISQSGYIITHSSYNGETVKSATLKDLNGNQIPVVIKNKAKGVDNAYFNLIIPRTPLKGGTTYSVTINGKVSTFTTSGTPAPSPTNPTTPPPTSGGSGVSGKYSATNVGIKLNDSFISVKPTAKVVNNSTFIPLRGVLENMGASLSWDGKLQTVTIQKDSTTIKLVIGSKRVLVNGKAQSLSVAPFLEKGYTFVPLRFISETLGANVTWNAKDFIASIDTSSSATDNGQSPSEPSEVLESYVAPIKSIVERHGLILETEEVNSDFTYGGYLIKDKSGNKLADYTQHISSTNKGQSGIYLTEILGSPDNAVKLQFLDEMIISLSGVSEPKPLDVIMEKLGREATMQDMLNGESKETHDAVTYVIGASPPFLGSETTGGVMIWQTTIRIKNP